MAWDVIRTRPLPRTRGLAFPAFIHNMQYHYTAISVYADGLIDCWGSVDRDLFRKKLEQGWVVSEAPTGAVISIFNLGGAVVGKAEWSRRSEEFLAVAERAISNLNPARTSLIDLQGEEIDVRNGVRYAKLGSSDGKPYKVDATKNEIPGDSMPVFEIAGSETYLRPWFVYADGSSQIGSGSTVSEVSEIEKKFETGELSTSVPVGTWINIEGLGRFQAEKCKWRVIPRQRICEALDKITILQGGVGSIHACLKCLDGYEKTPSDENRELLRHAYESVPEHLRCFCGNMDSKDYPIRKILYGQ